MLRLVLTLESSKWLNIDDLILLFLTYINRPAIAAKDTTADAVETEATTTDVWVADCSAFRFWFPDVILSLLDREQLGFPTGIKHKHVTVGVGDDIEDGVGVKEGDMVGV